VKTTGIITNLGMGDVIDEKQWFEAETIMALYRGRVANELTNRAVKTYGHEQLPFKRFDANATWNYMMLPGNNLSESFKVGLPQLCYTADRRPDNAGYLWDQCLLSEEFDVIIRQILLFYRQHMPVNARHHHAKHLLPW
jgi:hypothetical protein